VKKSFLSFAVFNNKKNQQQGLLKAQTLFISIMLSYSQANKIIVGLTLSINIRKKPA